MKTSNKNIEKHPSYVREITDEYFSAAGDLQIEGANATLILKVDKSKIRYVTFSKNEQIDIGTSSILEEKQYISYLVKQNKKIRDERRTIFVRKTDEITKPKRVRTNVRSIG